MFQSTLPLWKFERRIAFDLSRRSVRQINVQSQRIVPCANKVSPPLATMLQAAKPTVMRKNPHRFMALISDGASQDDDEEDTNDRAHNS